MFRNSKRFSINIKIFLIFTITFLSGCYLTNTQNPQFVISKPELRKDVQESDSTLLGVFFDVYNKSECSITYIEVRMNIYNKETRKSAFNNTGTIISEMNCSIPAGNKINLCIPLDNYITTIPAAGLLIDQFYISKIKFSDGSIWKDLFGINAISSE